MNNKQETKGLDPAKMVEAWERRGEKRAARSQRLETIMMRKLDKRGRGAR
jgi:hypothetical protein